MSKSTKYSQAEWENFLSEFLKGQTLTQLAKQAGYGVPFFSTKLKAKAQELGLLTDYHNTVKQQSIQRRGGVSYEHLYDSYLNQGLKNLTMWKPIPNFESYMVSDTGLVRNNKGKYLSGKIIANNHTKYMSYTLHKNGQKFTLQAHRLVLKAFNPNSDSTLQVDHIDGNGLNNHLSNLEWVTASENIQRSFYKNHHNKVQICKRGGKTSGAIKQDKARERLRLLMDYRFIQLNQGFVTYICESCGQTFTTSISSKAFRNGWKGVCTPCKRKITKEARLNAKSKQK